MKLPINLRLFGDYAQNGECSLYGRNLLYNILQNLFARSRYCTYLIPVLVV